MLATKQCSRRKHKRQCPNMIPICDARKTCYVCRQKSVANNHTAAGKAYQKRYWKGPKGKANQKRHNDATGKERSKRYDKTEKAKERNHRANSKPKAKLAHSLYMMVHGLHENPVTFAKLGIFNTSAEASAHFESTFEPWMTWQNAGKYCKGDAYNVKWQNGHRIPRCWYEGSDVEELKKCWSRVNLFAQCSRENWENNKRMALSYDEWMRLKPIWPKACAGMSDELAWSWANGRV